MKKYLGLLLLFCFAFSASETYNGHATIKHEGKLLFINAVPVNSYTVVGKAGFSNSKKNVAEAGADPTGLKKVAIAIEDAAKKELKGKQDPFDAAVVYSPTKIELIKFKSGVVEQNTPCVVGTKDYKKKCGEKDMFFLTRPSRDYEEVKVITVQNFTNLGQLKMGKNDIDNFLNKLYERACKEAQDGTDFDGVLMIDDNIAINGFITTKNLILIKYK